MNSQVSVVRAIRAITIGLGALILYLTTAYAYADPFIAGLATMDASDRLVDAEGNVISDASKAKGLPAPEVGLTDRLVVFLENAQNAPIDPNKVVLALNNKPITGLKDTIYLANEHALVFHLARTDANIEDWRALLGSPNLQPHPMEVGIWLDKPSDAKQAPIGLANGTLPIVNFRQISPGRLAFAVVAALLVIFVVFAAARKTNMIRDNLLPQLLQKDQPFSLGRTQMAFWFGLIFAAAVFLYALVGDYNTLTSQSLMLMGISGATAVFAVAIDASKDSPIGDANQRLRAIGLMTCEDVIRLDVDISQKQAQLPALDPAAQQRVQGEIADLLAKKRTYRDCIRPYVSSGWYRDLTTDINGAALHRLQVFYWTLSLGTIFLVQVYQTLTMPEFSATLLALMGVTSAGYLGFKIPEQQH